VLVEEFDHVCQVGVAGVGFTTVARQAEVERIVDATRSASSVKKAFQWPCGNGPGPAGTYT
jgi:hypothetical protein